jgi:hypothetical protein
MSPLVQTTVVKIMNLTFFCMLFDGSCFPAASLGYPPSSLCLSSQISLCFSDGIDFFRSMVSYYLCESD